MGGFAHKASPAPSDWRVVFQLLGVEKTGFKRNVNSMSSVLLKMQRIGRNEFQGVEPLVYMEISHDFQERFVRSLSRIASLSPIRTYTVSVHCLPSAGRGTNQRSRIPSLSLTAESAENRPCYLPIQKTKSVSVPQDRSEGQGVTRPGPV